MFAPFFVGSFNDNDFAESNVFEAVLRYVASANVSHCVGPRYVSDSVCQTSQFVRIAFAPNIFVFGVLDELVILQ